MLEGLTDHFTQDWLNLFLLKEEGDEDINCRKKAQNQTDITPIFRKQLL